MKIKFILYFYTFLGTLLTMTGCDTTNDPIPNLPVSIDLTGYGIWNTWGTPGYGMYREFILYNKTREPNGFPYAQNAATGFGGVLLINGNNPFSGEQNVPLAYDLACPVECKPTVRVSVNPDNYHTVCRVCGSEYDVTEAAGTAIYGPANKSKLRLKRYECLPDELNGGYLIFDIAR